MRWSVPARSRLLIICPGARRGRSAEGARQPRVWWRGASHAGSLRQVLTDETLRVLIGTALPRIVRRSEVHFDAGRFLELLIAVELGPIVERQRDGSTRCTLMRRLARRFASST